MDKIKQANFRIKESDSEKFRSFCKENGMNHADGFDHLIKILELSQAKSMIPERQLEIEDFETHIKAVLSAFVRSLEITQNTEARVLERYRTSLESKESLIMNLQKQLETKDAVIDALKAECVEAENRQMMAEKSEKEAKEKLLSAQEIVRDKEKICEMLNAKLSDAEQKVSAYDQLVKELETTRKELTKTKLEKDEENIALKIELAAVKNSVEERSLQYKKMEEKYLADIEKLEMKIDALQKERDFLKDENRMPKN